MTDKLTPPERLAIIETKLQTHIEQTEAKFDEISDGMKDIKKSVDSFTALLNKAAGIRWLLAVMAACLAWFGGLGDWIAKHLLR